MNRESLQGGRNRNPLKTLMKGKPGQVKAGTNSAKNRPRLARRESRRAHLMAWLILGISLIALLSQVLRALRVQAIERRVARKEELVAQEKQKEHAGLSKELNSPGKNIELLTRQRQESSGHSRVSKPQDLQTDLSGFSNTTDMKQGPPLVKVKK